MKGDFRNHKDREVLEPGGLEPCAVYVKRQIQTSDREVEELHGCSLFGFTKCLIQDVPTNHNETRTPRRKTWPRNPKQVCPEVILNREDREWPGSGEDRPILYNGVQGASPT